MKKANDLTRSAAMILAALTLTGCSGTAHTAPAPESTPPAITAAAEQEPEIIFLKRNHSLAVVRPAGEEKGTATGSLPGEDEAPPAEEHTEEEPTATPAPGEEPAPTAPPEPTPEPTAVPAPAPADGSIPFYLAAGTYKWWKIDSSDSAYWAVQDQVNAMRAAGGLPALSMDDGLSATASARCESFVAGGPFDHSGMVTKSEICAAGPLGSAGAVCGVRCMAGKRSPLCQHHAQRYFKDGGRLLVLRGGWKPICLLDRDIRITKPLKGAAQPGGP